MKITAGLMGVLAFGLLSVACDTKGGAGGHSSGGVAVIDLEAVAKRLGRDEAILSELKTTSESLGAKVSATQTELQKQFDEQRGALGATPSADDQQKLAKLQEELTAQLQAKQQEAQTELNKKRQAVITRFQEEVRPVARAIAQERGLDVILLKGDGGVFNAEPNSDITDAVVAKLIASAPAGAAAPAPAAAPAQEAAPATNP